MFEKIDRVCSMCGSGRIVYLDYYYHCTVCGNKDWHLRERENGEFNKDLVGYTEYIVNEKLKEYDKKIAALVLIMVQQGILKDVNELDDILNSMDVHNQLKK